MNRFQFNLVAFMFIVIGVAAGSYLVTLKIAQIWAIGDTSESWNFDNEADYTISDETKLEFVGNSVRLKAENYASDANTALLAHLDESDGTSVTDSSANEATGTATGQTWAAGNLNNALQLNGTTSYVSFDDSSPLSLTSSHTIEAWTKFSSDFSSSSHDNHQGIVDKGAYKLYYDYTSGKIVYELANSSATTWTQVAGNELNGSWDRDGKHDVRSQAVIGTDVYVGLGYTVGDAEVWKWSTTGSTWTQIGGDGLNSGWANASHESVLSLTTDGTNLYAGLGTNTGDGEVWKWNGSSWSKLGGDGIGWAGNTFEGVHSLLWLNSNLYAGLGTGNGEADLWRWDSESWTQIGGDGTGWAASTYNTVYAMATDGTNLFAGLGSNAGEAEVWKWDGETWSKIGGDGTGWADATYEIVYALTYANSTLYAGLGATAGDGELWSWNGTDWTKMGGDGTGWAGNKEYVFSLISDGTNLYVGLGSTVEDDEVWMWDGETWTQIGGDNKNSGWSHLTDHNSIYSLSLVGSTLFAGVSGTTATSIDGAQLWSWNGTSWTLVGGNFVNDSWGFSMLQNVENLASVNGKLYAGTGFSQNGNALVWEYDGTTWSHIGGAGKNSGWDAGTYRNVTSMAGYKGNLYAGLGTAANSAEVWKWDGDSWSKIGGDGDNEGWTTNYESVYSMTAFGGYLYAGLGLTALDSEVWRWDGETWEKYGGDGTNSSWNAGIESVLSLVPYNGKLYAGLGTGTGDAEVWQLSGSTWSQVGGDGTGWTDAEFEQVNVMAVSNGILYAGLGTGAGDAEVWAYDGSTWSLVGGDGTGWTAGEYEFVKSLTGYNGDLYAGLGSGIGDGEIWKWDGSAWSLVGGDGENSSWASTDNFEYVHSLAVYQGKLYAGTGDTADSDATVWSYGNNAVLQSVATTQDDTWHHIAASYDGTNMKLYIDGIVNNSSNVGAITLPDTTQDLLIGTTQGSVQHGTGQGFFAGSLDELRISSSARDSFTTAPYAATAHTVRNTSAVMTTDIKNWEEFIVDETTNGGTITYRLSSDGGTTWRYWSGSSWATSTSTTQANSATDINSHISSFPVGNGGIMWQAVLLGNGNQRVTLNSVTINATADTTAPTTNASSVVMYRSYGGTETDLNGWTNNPAPYFTWTAGADNAGGGGLKGYCLYLGADGAGDPATSKGILGTSPVSTTGSTCQFIVSGTSIDLATSNYLGTALASSTSPYYLSVKAVDVGSNIYAGEAAEFHFRFDNTEPTNVTFVAPASGSFSNVADMSFSWPTSGGSAASDSHSQILGWQYQLNSTAGTWLGTTTDSDLSINYIPTTENYRTLTQDQDGSSITSGSNTIYFRSVDNSGNFSSDSTIRTGTLLYGGSAPVFDSLDSVTITPATNTANSYSLSWPAATAASGQNITNYYYMINTSPPSTLATLQGNTSTYLDNGTSFTLETAALPNVNKGSNTVYVVAVDDADTPNYSPSNYITGTFTLNSTDPDNVGNLVVSDSSIKSQSSWNATLTWTAPAYTGAGNLSYLVYRSEDGTNFSQVGSTSGLSYVDNTPSSDLYYYKIYSKDGADAISSGTNAVSITPTGKWTSAPSLDSGPEVENITTKKATITWSTSRSSDSKVQYGTSSGSYGDVEPGNSTQTSSHSIQLTGLNPGTTYYYKAKWTDEDGNAGTSDEKTFTTAAAPTVKDVTAKNIGLISAIIQFTSKDASKIKIYYGTTTSFGGIKEISTSTSETTYTTELTGLLDGTKYYYKINTFDSDNSEYEGTVLDFITLPRPKISNVRIQQVANTAQSTILVTWSTNTEVSSIVTYYPDGKPDQARDEVNVALTEGDHRLIVRGLAPQTDYLLVVKGRDKIGNETTSDPQRLTTATDTRPPQISDLHVEGSNTAPIGGTAQESTSQLIVAWNTDEPATSQVEFGEGTGTSYSQKTQEDSNLTNNHLVIISGLTPSKVYHLRVISTDKAGNLGHSIDSVTITPKATENALDLVIASLQEAFGFLGSIRP